MNQTTVAPASGGEWRPITDVIRRKVLVTNNINARDANGQMSHVWIASLVQMDDNGGFTAMGAGSRRFIENLTHFAELPI